MNSSVIARIFVLAAGIYLFGFLAFYHSTSVRPNREHLRTNAAAIISDDPTDSRQYPQVIKSTEPQARFDDESDFKIEAPLIVESYDDEGQEEEQEEEVEKVEEEKKIDEPDMSQKIIDSLRRELEITRGNLLKFKIAKATVTERALEVKKNLKINFEKYQAKNQTLAYVSDVLAQINPFRKLGLYETMPSKYHNQKPNSKFLENQQYNAIKHNPGYCDAVDLYNRRNPENLFKNMNFIADYDGDENLVRDEVMRKIGNDVMPGLTRGETEHYKPKYELAVNGTMSFFKRVHLHTYYQMNQEWACLSQMYNHIPGHGVLTRKDLLVETINTYTQKYVDRPQCIQEDKFFPTAYRLDLKYECDRFFSIINDPKFEENKEKEPIQYLIKQGYGAHRASGIFLMDEEFEDKIRQMYQNGTLCGTVTKPYVAQKYISNPLLLDKKNKFDFRIYMVVASVDPLIVYYHDGFLRVSLSEYDKFSKEKNVHFTNTHLSKELFKKAQDENTFEGMTEEQLRDYQMWTMDELENYLLETGKVQDKNWLENYLRPKFKEAFVHIARMAESSFYKSPSVFEMYGLDFVIDEDLDIWLIEVNASPQLVGTSEKKSSFLTSMLTDLFELEYSYLRSRMKRVHNFVHDMEKRTMMGEELDYQKMSQEFKKININKLEPEFEISKNNSFVKILDKNLKGPAAYFGHISDQCVN